MIQFYFRSLVTFVFFLYSASMSFGQSNSIAGFLGRDSLTVRNSLSQNWTCRSGEDSDVFSCRIQNFAEIDFISHESRIHRIDVVYTRMGYPRNSQLLYPARQIDLNERPHDAETFRRFETVIARSDYYEARVNSETYFMPFVLNDPFFEFYVNYDCQFPLGVSHNIADCISFFEVSEDYISAHSIARIRRGGILPGYIANLAGHAQYLSIETGFPIFLAEVEMRRQQTRRTAEDARIERENAELRRLEGSRILSPD